MGYELKKGVDVIDFAIDIASGVERPTTQRVADVSSIMQEKFEESALFNAPKVDAGDLHAYSDDFFRYWGYLNFESPKLLAYRTYVVTHRAIYTKFTDVEVLKLSLGGSLFVSLVSGYLQFSQGSYGYYAVTLLQLPYLNTANVTALLFFSTAFTFAFPIINVHVICQKVQLFRYERAAGSCSLLSFLIAWVASEAPFSIAYTWVFGTILYFMADLGKGNSSYSFFIGTLILNGFIGITTCFLFAAIFRKELVVRDVFLLVLTCIVLLSAFPFQLKNMPSYLSDTTHVNPLRWVFEGLMEWKFSHYNDGYTWLKSYTFQAFDHNHLSEILFNFLWVAYLVCVLFLVAEPITLKRKKVDEKTRSQSRDSSRGSLDAFDINSLPRPSEKRTSELVKPLVFMRESSVTGQKSQLSVNLSQVGQENANHGPTVLFKDLTYRVRDRFSPLGYKTILNHTNGQFDWGKLSVIIGAAASGKTTLLEVLAGKVGLTAELTGSIRYDGEPPNPAMPLWERCALVPLYDDHIQDLTVQEVVTFAMQLRVYNSLGLRVVEENVKNTIDILHLNDIATKKAKNLTAGEAKRLSIAEEIVHGPKLLLMDEPTTGVSLNEQVVLMSTFRELVNADRTVIASMNQPSAEIFKLFDTLLLLSKGSVIYYGPVNQANSFFVNSPFRFNSGNYTNPAEFLCDISGGFVSDEKGEFIETNVLENYFYESEQFNSLANRFKLSEARAGKTQAVTENPLYGSSGSRGISPVKKPSLPSHNSSLSDKSDTASIEIEQTGPEVPKNQPKPLPALLRGLAIFGQEVFPFKIPKDDSALVRGKALFIRSVFALGNRHELIISSLVLHVLLACFFGWIMGDSSTSAAVYNVSGFLAIGSMFLILLNVQQAHFLFNNHKVFLKENARGLYSSQMQWAITAYPFYLLRVVCSILFSAVVYALIKLDTVPAKQGFFVFAFMMFVLASSMMSEAIIYAAPNLRGCYTTITAGAFVNFVFSGLFIKAGSLPDWMAPWAPSISMIRWNMQSNFINYYYKNPIFPSLPDSQSAIYTSFLNLFGWGGKTQWYCFNMLLANILVFRILTLVSIGFSSVAQRAGRKLEYEAK